MTATNLCDAKRLLRGRFTGVEQLNVSIILSSLKVVQNVYRLTLAAIAEKPTDSFFSSDFCAPKITILLTHFAHASREKINFY